MNTKKGLNFSDQSLSNTNSHHHNNIEREQNWWLFYLILWKEISVFYTCCKMHISIFLILNQIRSLLFRMLYYSMITVTTSISITNRIILLHNYFYLISYLRGTLILELLALTNATVSAAPEHLWTLSSGWQVHGSFCKSSKTCSNAKVHSATGKRNRPNAGCLVGPKGLSFTEY